MKTIKLLILIIAGMILLSRCDDFGSVNVDPNKVSTPDTRYLFMYTALYVPNFAWVGNYDPWNQLYPQYIAERLNIQYSNYAMTEFNTSGYYRRMIRNLDDIIQLCSDEKTKGATWVQAFGKIENQIAVARTLRAYAYMHLTDALGMIPYSEANKALEGLYTPKYDTQEFIYTDLDKELNEAFTQFDVSAGLDGTFDIFYKGDMNKWKRLNATLRMMMAIKLSKVAPAIGKTRFAKAYADGGITANTDLFKYAYLPENANANPLWENMILDGRWDFVPSATIIDQLKAYHDPRLKAYTVPNENGKYIGLPYGLRKDDLPSWQTGSYCNFHPKYYKQDAAITIISPSHALLLCAEAAVRGWIGADAESLYKAGIEASFSQHELEYDLDAYCAQQEVEFAGTEEQKIAKIAMQRWLANFMQDGIEAWSDWRRLGVPDLKPGPNADVTHIPYRRHYASDDFTPNMANYEAAIALQGPDNFDTRVWWNK